MQQLVDSVSWLSEADTNYGFAELLQLEWWDTRMKYIVQTLIFLFVTPLIEALVKYSIRHCDVIDPSSCQSEYLLSSYLIEGIYTEKLISS